MSQWQPIETAPKDGTWVLLSGGVADEDFYNSLPEVSDTLRRRPVVGHWKPKPYDDWVMAYWDGAWRTAYLNPTHWMPLPEPPAEAA